MITSEAFMVLQDLSAERGWPKPKRRTAGGSPVWSLEYGPLGERKRVRGSTIEKAASLALDDILGP